MINVKQWMDLPAYIKNRIVKDFNLDKTGRIGISRNIIISDGYTQKDLEKVNLKNLQTLMDSDETNFEELFNEYKNTITPEITVDVTKFIQETENKVVIIPPTTKDEVDLTTAPSGDKETYFGTKIKPISYETKKRK